MDTRPAHLLRILRLVLAIGVGAAAVFVLGLPRRSEGDRHLDARLRIHQMSRWFTRFLRRLQLVEVEVLHPERLHSGEATLLVANHPSLIDIVAILAHVKDADCVVNAVRAHDVLFAGVIREAGYIQNDGGHEVIKKAIRSLASGRSVILFPEGTRSPPEGLGPFRRGTAHIALASGRDVTPISIFVDPPALTKNRRWWHLPGRRIHMTLDVGHRLSPSPRTRDEPRRALAARQLTAELREAFSKELARERTPRART